MAKPKAKKTKKESAAQPTKSTYFVSITLGSKVVEGQGDTMQTALASMPVPVKIVSKGLLTLKHGESVFTKSYMPRECKRLFYPSARFVVAKQLAFLLK